MAEQIQIDIIAKDKTSAATTSALANFQKMGREITGIGRSMSNIFTRPIMDLERFVMKNKEVQEAMAPVTAKFEEVGNKLATAFLPVIERATPALLSLADSLSKIIEWFTKLPPGIQDAMVAFLGIVAAVGPALVIIGQLIVAFSAVATFFTTGAGAGFATAVVGVFGAITVPIWLLIGAFVLLGVTIAVFGERAWGTIQTIGKIFEALWTLIQIKIDQIKRAFISVDWAGLGRNLMQGVANGISAGLTWVVNAARNAAQSALNVARSILGINSPSTVFAGIGMNMMKGMAQGINANANLAIGATSSAVSDTVPAASSNTTNSSAVTVVYSPQVSFATQAEFDNVMLPLIRKAMRTA
jgi:hypothetical protein